ncbi:MAG: sensor histidine kinase [Lysobacterales bacterium]|jgi:signal transduction histidine kinase
MHAEPHEPADLRRQLAELLQEHRELIARLEQGQTYFRELARSVWRVQEEERGRLAHELHDGVGHNLTAMIHLIMGALAALPATADSAPARSGLERAQAIAATTLQDTRAMSRLLRPQILDDLGLEPALHWLVRTFSETHGPDVRLEFEPPQRELDKDRATLVFRIAQEALANIARHACATRVDIGFECRGGQAHLHVRDDGRGCDVDTALATGREGSSGGLGGMRDRVRLFGGSVRIDSAVGAGFAVAVEFPLADAQGRPR